MVSKTRSRKVTNAESSSTSREKVDAPGYRERVYDIVRRIPPGRVMTYGQIANMLGEGYTPRTVGYVMHASGEENVPWQRVINSQGACSTGRVVLPADMQQRLLESEGIKFDARGRCDLNEYRFLIDLENKQGTDTEDEKPPSLFTGATT
jgi:methylated-DNA-protein-cysteine methyltransferase-like protein